MAVTAHSPASLAEVSDGGRWLFFACILFFCLLLNAAELCAFTLLLNFIFFLEPETSDRFSKPRKSIMSTNNVLLETDPNAPSKMAKHVSSAKELERVFQAMLPCFEDRESEQNWKRRETNVLELRKLAQGNAPTEFPVQFAAGIKMLLDGILKTVKSLRTTLSSNGCELVKELSKVLGSSIDPMIDILLPALIELCGHTKTLNRKNGDETVTAVVTYATCNPRLLHYMSLACQNKNVPPREFAAGWIKRIIKKNGHHVEHGGGLDLIDNCIRSGLQDPKPEVREPMRSTYWTFAQIWPDRAESIMSSLDLKAQNALENSASNPKNKDSRSKGLAGKAGGAHKTITPAASRSSLKEALQAQKRAMKAAAEAAQSQLPTDDEIPRPNSALDLTGIAPNTEIYEISNLSKSTTSVPSRPTSKETMQTHKRPMKPTSDSHKAPDQTSSRPNSSSGASIQANPDPNQQSAFPKNANNVPARAFLSSAPIRRPRPPLPSTTSKGEPRATSTAAIQAEPHPFMPTLPTQNESKSTTADLPPRSVTPVTQTEVRHTRTESRPKSRIQPPSPSYKFDTRPTKPVAPVETEAPPQFRLKPRPKKPDILDDALASDIVPETPKELPKVTAARAATPATVAARPKSVSRMPIRSPNGPKAVAEGPKSPTQSFGENRSQDLDEVSMTEFSKNPSDTLRTHRSTVSNEPLIAFTSEEAQILPSSTGHFESPLRGLGKENEPETVIHTHARSWHNKEIAEKRRSISPRSKDPEEARKIMAKAIDKIKSRSIDDHDYRKLQGLIHFHDEIFEDEQKYDDMLLALLDALETPNTEKRMPLGRRFDNKFQILVTVRLMMVHNRKYFAAYFPRAMSAILTARRNFESRNHIVSGLEETAQDIIAACQPPDVIDAVLDVLETEERDESGSRAVAMGLHILSGLSARMRALKATLDPHQELRMARFGLGCLRERNSVVRRAVIEYCLELRRIITPEERFFRLVTGDMEDLKNLITYYAANSGN